MIMVWLYGIVSVLMISAVSLIGVFTLGMKPVMLKKLILIFVSLATGTLLGDALIHLIPEANEKIQSSIISSMLIVSGILFFFVMEKFIRWRHCHDLDCDLHTHHLAPMNIMADTLHNFIDGLLIGASYLVSFPLGMATTIAVLLHEIPQEIGDFGVLIYSGMSVTKALFINFLVALGALLGLIISLLLGSIFVGYSLYLLPFTAGGFIYIATSDLIPELHKESDIRKSLWQVVSMIIGVLLMVSLLFLD